MTGLLIPNKADAAYADQSAPDSLDFSAIVAGFGRTGVVSGCGVTPQGSPDMTVAVSSGSVLVNGTLASVTGGNLTIGTADGTYMRFDLIVADDSGTKSVIAGTASSVPAFPTIASNNVLLAAVCVPALAGSVVSNMIVDKRVMFTAHDHSNEGTAINPASLIVTGQTAYTGVITPTILSANANDYAPTGFATAYQLRLSSNASRNITGIAGGSTGRRISLHNVGSNDIVLKNASTSSTTAANRFAFSSDITLQAGDACDLEYDGTLSRWRCTGVARTQSTGSGGTPALVLGTANTPGSSTTFIRDDDTILVFDSTAPTDSLPGDAAAAGSGATAAHRTHTHGRPAEYISVLGPSNFLFTTSSSSFQNITGLSFTIGASSTEIWVVEVLLDMASVNTTMDAKFIWTVPSGATGKWGGFGGSNVNANFYYGGAVATSNTPNAATAITSQVLAATFNGDFGLVYKAKVFGGGTGGTVQLQGAQFTPDSGQLTAYAGSSLVATRIRA